MTAARHPAAAPCVFCTIDPARVVASNALAVAVRDIAPVTPLHTLVLPRRHAPSYFDLAEAEKRAIDALLAEARGDILARDPAVAGFNIAINIGAAGGQTILHCHLHLVPRRPGDGDAVILDGRAKRLVAAGRGA